MSGAPVNISQAFQTLGWLSSEERNTFPLHAQTATHNKLNFCFADVFYLSRGEGGGGNVFSQSAVSSYMRPATALRRRSFCTDAAGETAGTQLQRTCHSFSKPPQVLLEILSTHYSFYIGGQLSGQLPAPEVCVPC